MATLDLPETSACTAVWRACWDVLSSDPILNSVVDLWKGGGEGPSDRNGFPKNARVGVRLRPRPESATWYGPNAQTIRLVVDCELEVEGLDPDDVMDLWLAVMRAFYPKNDPTTCQAIRVKLVEAGADSGEVLFDNPADDPSPEPGDDGRWMALGRFSLFVIQPLQ